MCGGRYGLSMRYNIRYLPLAEEDISALAAYLLRFYPGTAARVLGEIEKQIASLQEHPRMCEEYSDDPFYRRMVVAEYLVFYHVNEKTKTVDIHRVLRGSWNIEAHLPPPR